MTIQEKKEYLSRFLQAERQIEQKLDEVERLHSMAERVTSLLSEMPHGSRSKSSRIEWALERLEQLNREIEADIEQYILLQRGVTAILEQLSDMTMRTVLEYRYLNGATWEQIAEKMGFTYQWVCSLHQKALKQLHFPEEAAG